MRVALVSTGLGRVKRGFEAFTESLFEALRRDRPDVDVTLFQGGGAAAEHRVVVPNLHRANFPARHFNEYTAGLIEKRSFALALYPRLRWGYYDVVHYNELTMGSVLFHLRNLFGGSFKLIYCNGAPSPPAHYHHRCDFVQVLTRPDFDLARSFGIPADRLFQLPYGVDADRFSREQKKHRTSAREELGVPSDAKVVLSVAAIKSEHKRIDYLIREVAALSTDAWLVVAGQRTPETEQLELLAESMMPGRWKFVSWPHYRVSELYGAADCFVLCSLTEAFGLVTIEAMLSELPVIVHDGPVFKWLAEGTTAELIDMSQPGALSSAVRKTLACAASQSRVDGLGTSRRAAETRFSWRELVPEYVNMYRTAITNP